MTNNNHAPQGPPAPSPQAQNDAPTVDPASPLSVSGLPLQGLHKSALREACELAGGQKSLAARIGTTQSMVWYWLVRSKRGVPGEFVLAVEAVTGISRHALRPDIFPEPDPTSNTDASSATGASQTIVEDCR
ncbi:transcriptional regulator [Bradyrhizobium prioriisuperbiae]|uniref:transcriptional regulator n=1 Tax=Bradyrhizobium prioriisuperbiae TaxID=2854389 RepID=UPI0028E6CA84|nr:YdaS family helix-turn-helix protein [Bradyrhizobium prioritasuperba]